MHYAFEYYWRRMDEYFKYWLAYVTRLDEGLASWIRFRKARLYVGIKCVELD